MEDWGKDEMEVWHRGRGDLMGLFLMSAGIQMD